MLMSRRTESMITGKAKQTDRDYVHLERDNGQIHVGKRRNEARQEKTFPLVSTDIRNEGLACRRRWFERQVSSGRLDGVVAKFYCQKDHQHQLLPAFKLLEWNHGKICCLHACFGQGQFVLIILLRFWWEKGRSGKKSFDWKQLLKLMITKQICIVF